MRPTEIAESVRSHSARQPRTAHACSILTLRLLQHGNKPSRGAKIDQQIEDEERAELERKGKA